MCSLLISIVSTFFHYTLNVNKIFWLISGVGLNLDNVEPTTCLNAVLRKLISTQHKIKREEFLSAFFNKFEDYFETFLRQGTCDMYCYWLPLFPKPSACVVLSCHIGSYDFIFLCSLKINLDFTVLKIRNLKGETG